MIVVSFPSMLLIVLPTREAGELGVLPPLSAAALSVHLCLWHFLSPVHGAISCQLPPACLTVTSLCSTVTSPSRSQKTKGQLSIERKAAESGGDEAIFKGAFCLIVDDVWLLYYCSLPHPLHNPNEQVFVLFIAPIIVEINS